MVFILVVLFEIDFSHMLIMEIHERVFKSTTTYPFPFLIFLMLDAGVLVWHSNKLIQETKTLDISLIRDEENIEALCKELQIEVAPFGVDLVDNVEQMQRWILPPESLLRMHRLPVL